MHNKRGAQVLGSRGIKRGKKPPQYFTDEATKPERKMKEKERAKNKGWKAEAGSDFLGR